MASDTYGIETDRHIEEAKASMTARMEEIGRRLADVRHKVDIKAHIAAHPLPAAGIAFVVGMALGFVPGKKKQVEIEKEDVQRSVGGIIGGMIMTLALRIAKDMLLRRVSSSAQTWWDERQKMQGVGRPMGAEIFEH